MYRGLCSENHINQAFGSFRGAALPSQVRFAMYESAIGIHRLHKCLELHRNTTDYSFVVYMSLEGLTLPPLMFLQKETWLTPPCLC
jgi:hypothetical protein